MMAAPAAEGAEYLFFDTFEAREAAFSAAVADLVPVRHQGPQAFWRDFRRLSGAAPLPAALPAAITGNPRDGLAFGSAYQELTAAYVAARSDVAASADAIAVIAERFALAAALHQPLRTLSGGETVRLALAKVLVAEPRRPELVIASPFTWLSATHRPLLEQAITAYYTKGKAVRILALAGENDPAPMGACWIAAAPAAPLPFRMTAQGVRIVLGLPVNALTAVPAAALVKDAVLELASPCLIAGENGQGKSLLAKALSGAATTSGRLVLHCAGGRGRARLIFQDVINQTLLRRLADLAPGASAGAAQIGFEGILRDYKQILRQCSPAPALAAPHPADLLAVKAMLAAVRLAACPAALILDEPDWGLSRDAALALVLAIVRAAHACGVPVLIISHKPWWVPLAHSRLTVVKTPSAVGRFDILLIKRDT